MKVLIKPYSEITENTQLDVTHFIYGNRDDKTEYRINITNLSNVNKKDIPKGQYIASSPEIKNVTKYYIIGTVDAEGVVTSDGVLYERTEEEIKQTDAYINNKMNEIRTKRDKLLSVCDFVILPDSPATEGCKTAYETYRQALRDLPSNITDVDSVTWPEKPEYVKE